MFELINQFELRNNVSIRVAIYIDSYEVEEFWSEDVIHQGKTSEELEAFLRTANYKKCPDTGRCLSPMKRIDKPATEVA